MRIGFLQVFAMLAASAAATPCYGQAIRTFVSSNGSDSNDCSRQSPCRSFATAITKTAAGGEINTLDPGGYGAVTITKSISIVSGLGEAGVLVPAGGVGVTINAGATDQINLRGLAIEGAGTGKTGILFKAGGSLTVTNTVVRNLVENAIDLEPTTDSGFTIADTLTTDNGRVGIYLYPQGSAGRVKASISRVTMTNNQWGLYANGNATQWDTVTVDATVSDSTVSYNVKGDGTGIYGNGNPGGSGANVLIVIANSNITYNGEGIASAGANIRLYGSRLLRNLYRDYSCGTRFPTYISSYKNNIIGSGLCTISPTDQQ